MFSLGMPLVGGAVSLFGAKFGYQRVTHLHSCREDSLRSVRSLRPYIPRGVSFGDPIYEDNEHILNMAHYRGFKSQRMVSIYRLIAQKMFVRAGGSISGQATLVANLIGYGMREFPDGDYAIMTDTALYVFQQVLANKDRVRYALPTNVGNNATVSTTFA